MNNAIESKRTSSRLSVPIAEMGAWSFWVDAYSIGLPLKDAAAIDDGSADADQQIRAQIMGELAKRALIAAPAGVPFGRPS
jgi:hypothetical protein